jgi:hypothetical protein
MFIFAVQTLQKKWNETRMKQLAGGKHMENDCFSRTLKFEMKVSQETKIILIFRKKECLQGSTLRDLLLYRIFSEFEGKKIFLI